MKRLIPILLILLITSPLWAFGPNNRLCWDQNVETDLAGYKAHWGAVAGTYTSSLDVGLTPSPAAPCVPLSDLNLADGDYFFVVTAYDTSGNESGYSNEVAGFFDQTVPVAPGGLRIE